MFLVISNETSVFIVRIYIIKITSTMCWFTGMKCIYVFYTSLFVNKSY